jgi:predicted RNA-binding Zn-ribbon protein involved in translation (DUF1610 family)
MKYRHRGYRESEREDRPSRPKGPPRQSLTTEERIQKRSLRHAIDREARQVVRCHNCGQNVQNTAITIETSCPHCAAPLHCCRTCRHFDSSARWQCRAEISEAVSDKSKTNRCSKHEPRLVLDVTGRRTRTGGTDDPKSQFENLFKR